MYFLENLADDQLAVIACVLAFVFCIGILVVMPGLRERTVRMSKSKSRTSPRFLSRDKHVPTQ